MFSLSRRLNVSKPILDKIHSKFARKDRYSPSRPDNNFSSYKRSVAFYFLLFFFKYLFEFFFSSTLPTCQLVSICSLLIIIIRSWQFFNQCNPIRDNWKTRNPSTKRARVHANRFSLHHFNPWFAPGASRSRDRHFSRVFEIFRFVLRTTSRVRFFFVLFRFSPGFPRNKTRKSLSLQESNLAEPRCWTMKSLWLFSPDKRVSKSRSLAYTRIHTLSRAHIHSFCISHCY